MYIFPILKGKKGEYTALAGLIHEIKNNTIPIIDLVPVVKGKSFEKHLRNSINYIKKYWGRDLPIYIDGYMPVSGGAIALSELLFLRQVKGY